MKTWMVRAGSGGRYFDRWKSENIVAIGWHRVGNFGLLKSKEQFVSKVRSTFPEYKDQQIIVAASQVHRFAMEFEVGDRVVTYDAGSRRYLCGVVAGPYQHVPDVEEENFSNIRQVKWQHERLRDDLSSNTRKSLGSLATIFLISGFASAELWSESAMERKPAVLLDEASIVGESTLTLKAIEDAASERITDRLNGLDPEEMEQLVAGVLRAMGYRTWRSPKGKDRGVDILASPDGFGFQEPRIVVEVKHRYQQRIGAPEIRAFLGGRRPGDKGLFVSTGGFSYEARYEAERAQTPLVLWDFGELTRTLLEYYGSLDAETRQLIPLKTVYWTLDE